MTSRDFAFWLQGAIELAGLNEPLSADQMECVARHLSLVELSHKPVAQFSRADSFVFRLQNLDDSKVDWGEGKVWQTLVRQLNDVFEHQLDNEVPFNPNHKHDLVRC